MAKIMAIVCGGAALAAIAACVDGASLVAERGDVEEIVSLDEAVIEIDPDAAFDLDDELQGYAAPAGGAESDIVDLDWASEDS